MRNLAHTFTSQKINITATAETHETHFAGRVVNSDRDAGLTAREHIEHVHTLHEKARPQQVTAAQREAVMRCEANAKELATRIRTTANTSATVTSTEVTPDGGRQTTVLHHHSQITSPLIQNKKRVMKICEMDEILTPAVITADKSQEEVDASRAFWQDVEGDERNVFWLHRVSDIYTEAAIWNCFNDSPWMAFAKIEGGKSTLEPGNYVAHSCISKYSSLAMQCIFCIGWAGPYVAHTNIFFIIRSIYPKVFL